MRISDRLRAGKAVIAERWERAVRDRGGALARLDRAVLLDRLPALLDGLGAWVDGDEPRGRQAFDALAAGHALRRLDEGVDLATLTLEHQVLRSAILRVLLEDEPTGDERRALIRADEGLDAAVVAAVRRYVVARDERRERFLGILGHDLRAPLQVAQLAFTRLAQVNDQDPSAARAGERGLHSIERMNRMIQDVLDFARTQLGDGIVVRPGEGDLGAIARAAVDDVRSAHPGRTIALTTRGDLRGRWDRARVTQAIANLVGNAVEHGQDPVEVIADGTGPTSVVTEISSTGPAIAPDLLRVIYEPFQRGEPRAGGGLGLGLSIVRAIATAHGATCDASSDARATRFRITWPRALP